MSNNNEKLVQAFLIQSPLGCSEAHSPPPAHVQTSSNILKSFQVVKLMGVLAAFQIDNVFFKV